MFGTLHKKSCYENDKNETKFSEISGKNTQLTLFRNQIDNFNLSDNKTFVDSSKFSDVTKVLGDIYLRKLSLVINLKRLKRR